MFRGPGRPVLETENSARITICIPPLKKELLIKIAEDSGLSVAGYIRRLVFRSLDERKKAPRILED